MTTYKDAGVNIEEGYKAVNLIKSLARETFDSNVITDIGSFGSMYLLNIGNSEYILVSGTDGVGTKLKIAFYLDKHDTVGIDCVAMCVNDILCHGAKPLFFLDYIACGKLNSSKVANIVKGIAEGCKMAGCSLVGGETAEMPGFYKEDEYDLAGFVVGIVERQKAVCGKDVNTGDVLIGLASSGVHSNGYSLVRKVFGIDDNPKVLEKIYEELGLSLGEELLKPTRIYVKPVLKVLERVNVKGIAHITGGGFFENIPRAFPKGYFAIIEKGSWEVPAIFRLIQEYGKVEEREMFSTFNMGIGMVLIVSEEDVDLTMKILEQEKVNAWVIGTIQKGEDGVVLK
ncbi:phosphoribosylformylglycinamidine cyclo-ligase [Caldicellulosiruptor bescii]|jgi:phosphoribosylformylglycinamidine cyclo-ligase|uniref:Phosphoribosylformylglycinamidine cyclo-ligase n=2 Tax=Caldicellulosiruptor bescii TaxID=31899 RepID=PUR5_CALBD|nr:phosphoribosylformylglycinamidine cyclo-ligase [Caldicellulosiruptor bescii]B9MS91.1 RecName: Full=Phosphoribosylformylglycinamidine cyclo-ligase; AltName: Full=AIR synthase; AltName: Full=AIRS; AltName: Full=Phosphoribosyl-aminoimidazole synthetase [Caldicellulosiruptor bescii DSM 6725]ACM60545.1 phosphoribosylformylglycinamidine cyclo-ligase [Caldicellulosiruptor bescii DSM 6725]PBC87956.1 phosphoribosylformylglycinamidine cyclo-ligase [Caldicellulosiruptor bescii]PBC90888.1 phosphoribosyl